MTGTPPEAWTITKIGDVATLLRGVTYKKADSSKTPGEGLVPILRATNIRDDLDFEDLVYVPGSYVTDEQMLRRGDIVIAASSGSRAVVGKAAPLREGWDGSFGAFCFALRPASDLISPRYLAYFLRTPAYRHTVSTLSAGVNINNLKRIHIESLELPLAPYAEQERLADALDEQLSKVDAAVDVLALGQANLRRYRASVLKAAVEGRVVTPEVNVAGEEGRDYDPAEVLLDRICAERRRRWEAVELGRLKTRGRSPTDDRWKRRYREPAKPDTEELPALPAGWCWATLDQLSYEIRNGYSKAPREDSGIPILRISAVRPMEVDLADVRYLPEQGDDYAAFELAPGDLLFTRYNGTRELVGVCGLVPEFPRPLLHPDKLIRVRLVPDGAVGRFVELAANCGVSRGFLERRIRTTAGQSGVSGGDLKSLPVPLPPRAEQARISDEVDRLLSTAVGTGRLVASALRRCHRLREAILSWAFSGRLVDQSPRDEPAAELLARISSQRENAREGGRGARRRR